MIISKVNLINEYKFEKIKLADICDIVTGSTPLRSNKEYYGGSIPWVKPNDLDCSMYVSSSDEYLTLKGGSHARILPKGAVLISCIGYLGKLAISERELATNQQINALVPNNTLDSEYLFFVCKSIKPLLDKFASKTVVPIINKSVLSNITIPILPIHHQHQIATKLKSQLAEVEAARKALEKQDQEIINLANAYIRQSIEKSKATEQRLGDVLEDIKKGIGDTWKEYPVLGATRNGLAPAKEPPGKYPHRYKPVFNQTVFYNPMRIMIGSIAFVDNEDKPGITSPDYVALKGKENQVDSRWFYYWLRSPYGEHCINSLARGAVRERMLFNRLAEGVIQLPSYQEQCNISKSLAALRPIKNAIQQQLDDLNKIPQRILAQIFNTPTQ